MMTFIYNSVLLPDFRGSLQVRLAFNTTFGASSCRVVDSYKSCLHETSLYAQSFRFLSRKNRTIIHFSSSELRSNQFLDSLGGISSHFVSVSECFKHLFLGEDFYTMRRRLNFALIFCPYCCRVYFWSFILFDNWEF